MLDKTKDPTERDVEPPDQDLDITGEVCPMTFVRTRLMLDRMQCGQTLRIRLRGAEPLESVPRSAIALGHGLVSQETGADGVSVVVLRVGAPRAG